MAPSGRDTCMDISGGSKGGRSISSGCLLQVSCRCSVVNSTSKVSEEWKMAGLIPLSKEGSKEGYNCSRCGGRSAGSSRKEAKEISSPGDGGDNSGERWFNLENSQAERRLLLRLEHELDASLLFEHGGGPRVRQLWVMRILLGWLFRVRLVLGQAIKLYAKFQRREIMRCMVKINDLEEIDEPPLGGTPGASTSSLPKDDTMGVDESVGL